MTLSSGLALVQHGKSNDSWAQAPLPSFWLPVRSTLKLRPFEKSVQHEQECSTIESLIAAISTTDASFPFSLAPTKTSTN